MTPEQVKELVERLLVPIDVGMVRHRHEVL